MWGKLKLVDVELMAFNINIWIESQKYFDFKFKTHFSSFDQNILHFRNNKKNKGT